MQLTDGDNLQTIVLSAPIGICVLNACTLTAEIVNDKFLEIAGKPKEAIIGKWYWEPFAEARIYYEEALSGVAKTGEAYYADEAELMLVRNGREEIIFVTFVYSPVKNKDGQVIKVAVWVLENTHQVKSRQAIHHMNEELAAANEELIVANEELQKVDKQHDKTQQQLKASVRELAASRERFSKMIQASPVALLVTRGDNMIFEEFNQAVLDMVGKDESIKGKPWFEAIPELKGQAVLNDLYHTYRTGEALQLEEVPITMNRNGKPYEGFYSINYMPLIEDGMVTGVMQSVIDETLQINARKKVEQLYEELTAANEELAAANEELTVANEELAAINEELTTTQQALQQAYELSDRQKRLYETIASSTPDLMYVFDLDYRFTYANSALLSMWGKTWDNAVGKSLLENGYEPWHAEMHEQEIDKVKATKKPIRGEVSFPHATLGRRVYDYIFTPVINKQGEVEAVAGTTRDVTERKQWEESLARSAEELQSINEEMATSNEELADTNNQLSVTQQTLEATVDQLKQSRSRFQNLIREASIGIIVLMGDEMRVEIVNKAYGKLISRSVDDLLGHRLFDIIPEMESAFRHIIDTVRVSGETLYLYDTPYLVYSNGQKIEGFLNLIYQPYVEDDQIVIGVIVLCQDVTEQVQGKISLESAYEQLRLSKDAAQLGFFDMDLIKGTLEWDTRCRELFGITHTGTITYEEDFVPNLHPEDRDRILSIINNVFVKSVSNGVYDVEYRTVGAEDQQIRWVRAKGQAYFDQDDKPVRFIGSVLDITEQKKDEIRKNDFIGMVSHELKTPLTSLTAIIQIANHKLKSSEDRFLADAMEKANVQVKRMNNMINGFLNISRLESAKIFIDKHEFDLEELIEEIIKETELILSSHQIIYQRCLSVVISADRDKIASVITNLISNAIKYSPKAKEIEVKCEVIGNNVQVSIKDEGMGLKPQDKDKVFDRYFRVEDNDSRHISGFGIGLYLSAEIINRHNGRIWVESESGNGSTFYFTLPL